jgi:hypothetical protein
MYGKQKGQSVQGVQKGILLYHVPDVMSMRGEYGNMLCGVKLLRTAGDDISRDIAVGSTRRSSHALGVV